MTRAYDDPAAQVAALDIWSGRVEPRPIEGGITGPMVEEAAVMAAAKAGS